MKHYGDIMKLNGADLPPVDIITGGSPCQDLSVAGKRAGLAGERSGLFMEQIRVIKEMRRATNGKQPRFMVWENVPGAFSSNKGEDFRCVLEETARVADQDAVIPGLEGKQRWTPSGCIMGDGWSIAWRVHDAQFWGVPQRRKRISLVADFGGGSAPEILFERESVSGDTAQGGKEREGAAGDVEESVDKTGGVIVYGIGGYNSEGMKSSNPHSGIYEADTSRTLDLNGGNPACNQGGMAVVEPTVFDASRRHNYEPFGHVCETVQAHYGTGGGNVPIVLEGNGSRPSHSGDGRNYVVKEEPTMIEMTSTKNTIVEDGISPTLTARMGTGGNQVNAVCTDIGFFQSYEERAGTLLARQYKDPPVVSYCMGKQADFAVNEEVANTISGSGPSFVSCTIVRRLTPLECERLQGFPDGWADIGDWVDSKGKKHKGDADSPRYKALGNSIALPFWKWMAERMVRYIPGHVTMGSLFDGIGGFPLAFQRCGCEPVWASEIEEFPIAVTKKRFYDMVKS